MHPGEWDREVGNIPVNREPGKGKNTGKSLVQEHEDKYKLPCLNTLQKEVQDWGLTRIWRLLKDLWMESWTY